MMKIASFNANGIRARLPLVQAWLEREKPCVLCLQETKVPDSDFPEAFFTELGYQCGFKGEKGYNGVAILSRRPLEDVRVGCGDLGPVDETRVISASVGPVRIVNTYVPQGVAPGSEKFRYKLDFFGRLRDYFAMSFSPAALVVWVGDFNVAPEPMDVYDPARLLGSVGFHPEEQAALARVKQWGFVDVFRRHVSGGGQYTFWDYRVPNAVERGLGWRIDHIWATLTAAMRSQRAWIDREARLAPRPSDHTFIAAEFDFNGSPGV
jgi:exodeoxyribonuclease III